jgi:hypothetical protein
MVEFPVAVIFRAMNLSRFKRSDDIVPKQAPYGERRVLTTVLRLGSKCLTICYNIAFSFDQEPAWQLKSNPCERRAFVPHPSTWRLRLVSICPYAQSSNRCWDPRHYAIGRNTVVSFDRVQAWRLQTNSCRCALLPHPSTYCLCQVSIYYYAQSSGLHGDL